MAVRIRLARHGRTKLPFYRLVVADSHCARNGRFIEQLGTYDPMKDPGEIKINNDAAVKWLRNGALPSDTARALLKKAGVEKKDGVWTNLAPAVPVEPKE